MNKNNLSVGTKMFKVGIVLETASLPFVVLYPLAALWLFIAGATLAISGFITEMILDN